MVGIVLRERGYQDIYMLFVVEIKQLIKNWGFHTCETRKNLSFYDNRIDQWFWQINFYIFPIYKNNAYRQNKLKKNYNEYLIIYPGGLLTSLRDEFIKEYIRLHIKI